MEGNARIESGIEVQQGIEPPTTSSLDDGENDSKQAIAPGKQPATINSDGISPSLRQKQQQPMLMKSAAKIHADKSMSLHRLLNRALPVSSSELIDVTPDVYEAIADRSSNRHVLVDLAVSAAGESSEGSSSAGEDGEINRIVSPDEVVWRRAPPRTLSSRRRALQKSALRDLRGTQQKNSHFLKEVARQAMKLSEARQNFRQRQFDNSGREDILKEAAKCGQERQDKVIKRMQHSRDAAKFGQERQEKVALRRQRAIDAARFGRERQERVHLQKEYARNVARTAQEQREHLYKGGPAKRDRLLSLQQRTRDAVEYCQDRHDRKQQQRWRGTDAARLGQKRTEPSRRRSTRTDAALYGQREQKQEFRWRRMGTRTMYRKERQSMEERKQRARENLASTKIQSLTRGYLVRRKTTIVHEYGQQLHVFESDMPEFISRLRRQSVDKCAIARHVSDITMSEMSNSVSLSYFSGESVVDENDVYSDNDDASTDSMGVLRMKRHTCLVSSSRMDIHCHVDRSVSVSSPRMPVRKMAADPEGTIDGAKISSSTRMDPQLEKVKEGKLLTNTGFYTNENPLISPQKPPRETTSGSTRFDDHVKPESPEERSLDRSRLRTGSSPTDKKAVRNLHAPLSPKLPERSRSRSLTEEEDFEWTRLSSRAAKSSGPIKPAPLSPKMPVRPRSISPMGEGASDSTPQVAAVGGESFGTSSRLDTSGLGSSWRSAASPLSPVKPVRRVSVRSSSRMDDVNCMSSPLSPTKPVRRVSVSVNDQPVGSGSFDTGTLGRFSFTVDELLDNEDEHEEADEIVGSSRFDICRSNSSGELVAVMSPAMPVRQRSVGRHLANRLIGVPFTEGDFSGPTASPRDIDSQETDDHRDRSYDLCNDKKASSIQQNDTKMATGAPGQRRDLHISDEVANVWLTSSLSAAEKTNETLQAPTQTETKIAPAKAKEDDSNADLFVADPGDFLRQDPSLHVGGPVADEQLDRNGEAASSQESSQPPGSPQPGRKTRKESRFDSTTAKPDAALDSLRSPISVREFVTPPPKNSKGEMD